MIYLRMLVVGLTFSFTLRAFGTSNFQMLLLVFQWIHGRLSSFGDSHLDIFHSQHHQGWRGMKKSKCRCLSLVVRCFLFSTHSFSCFFPWNFFFINSISSYQSEKLQKSTTTESIKKLEKDEKSLKEQLSVWRNSVFAKEVQTFK